MTRLGLLFLLIFSMSAQAQTSTPSPSSNDTSNAPATPTVWFTAGPGFSNLTGQDSLIETERTGLMVGADYELPLTQTFSVQAGLDYIQKGQHVNGILASPNNTQDYQLNYFEIPVVARVNLSVYKVDKVSFFAGPYAAIAVSRNLNNSNNTDIHNPVVTNTSLSSSLKSYDFGVRLGAAFEIPLTDTWIATAGADYDLGLMNIDSVDGGPTVNNRSLLVSLGLGMKL